MFAEDVEEFIERVAQSIAEAAAGDGELDPEVIAVAFGAEAAADPWDEAGETCDDMEAEYQSKLAKWARSGPQRQAAQRAMQAARGRRAGYSLPEPARIAAMFDYLRPERPSAW